MCVAFIAVQAVSIATDAEHGEERSNMRREMPRRGTLAFRLGVAGALSCDRDTYGVDT
jgi:hypothetical protein